MLGDVRQRGQDGGICGRSTIGGGIDVQHHVLGRSHDGVVVTAMHGREQSQALVVVRQQLHRDIQPITGPALSQVVDVALDSEEAASRFQVRGIHTDEAQEPVARLAGQLHVPAVVRVPVVVDPLGGDAALVEAQRSRDVDIGFGAAAAIEQLALVVVQHFTGAVADRAQALHDCDQAVVAQHFQFADGRVASLQVRLIDNAVQQLVGQVGNIHQLRPRPLEGRAELGHEVAHAGLAAGDAVHQERPHETPAQARPEADRVIDLFGRCDAVVHQPQRLAPQRLHQAVGDEAVDLLAQAQRAHTDGFVHGGSSLGRGSRRLLATAHLDQRQQVHRVERVSDHEALGMVHAVLHQRGQQARRGRTEHHVGAGGGAGPTQQILLQLQAFGCALLNEVDIGGRVLGGCDKSQGALGGQCRHDQLGQRSTGIGHDFAHLARGFGVGVEHLHVDAVQQEPCGPAATDDAAAQQTNRRQTGYGTHVSRA